MPQTLVFNNGVLDKFQANDKNIAKQNTPSAPVKTNPVKQVVDLMRKIDTKSPDAAKNEKVS
jgi:hypothetical protein